jgi:hypothetical protein
MRTLPLLAALLVAAPLSAAPLKHLTYAELCKQVRSYRGKPVVVYFWGST